MCKKHLSNLTNNCIYRMAALLVQRWSKSQWSMQKYCNYLGRDCNLESVLPFAIRVPLELSCQPKVDLALQSQRPPMQIHSAIYIYKHTYVYIYMYIYTIFAVAVYLSSTHILIHTWSTNWYNEYPIFQDIFGQRTLARVYQDHLSKPMELQKASSQK